MQLNRSIKNRDHISFTFDWDWNGNHSATFFSPTNNDSDNNKTYFYLEQNREESYFPFHSQFLGGKI